MDIVRTFRLSRAESGQAQAIFDLIRQHGGPVFPRTEIEMLDNIASGLTWIISFNTRIAATASIFTFEGNFHELGGCVVHGRFRGLGFQRELLAARLDHLKAQNIPNDKIVTGVGADNEQSKRNIKTQGFVEWPEPDKALLAPCRLCSKQQTLQDEVCCATFYRYAPNNQNRHFE